MDSSNIDNEKESILDSIDKDDKSFLYSPDNFHINPQNSSLFDTRLQLAWESCMKNGYFRYSLTDIKARVLPGKYRFIAKLNVKRATERRLPQLITDVKMPFNSNDFHFGKVQKEEIMMELIPTHWLAMENHVLLPITEDIVLMINVSPFEYCHSLLVPYVNQGLPQVLNITGLRLALETMLISQEPALRIGFNSLGAYASVNHLHFHLYYLKHSLYLEDMAVNCLKNECYEIIDFPSQGFAFQVVNEDIELILGSIMKLIDFLLEKRIAHNLFITRGTRFDNTAEKSTEKTTKFNAIRVYVWARKPFFGIKSDINMHEMAGFNPAVCELGGHLPMKDIKSFENITEEKVCEILKEVCSSTFLQIREEVKKLYDT